MCSRTCINITCTSKFVQTILQVDFLIAVILLGSIIQLFSYVYLVIAVLIIQYMVLLSVFSKANACFYFKLQIKHMI
jgi:hypothetical protein